MLGLYSVLKNTCGHLVGDACFFDMLEESRGCAMCVQSLAGSRFIKVVYTRVES